METRSWTITGATPVRRLLVAVVLILAMAHVGCRSDSAMDLPLVDARLHRADGPAE
jgi:hypothetical protein